METNVYIVLKTTGHYEDSYTCPVKAFTSLDKACEYAEQQNAYYTELDRKYEEFGHNGEGLCNDLFERYLETVNKKLYKKVRSDNDDVTDEEWDEYDERYEELMNSKELMEEYINSSTFTDKEIEAIRVYKEWGEVQDCGVMPYFAVYGQPIKIEE